MDELIEPLWVLFKLVIKYTYSTENIILARDMFLERDGIFKKILCYVILTTESEEELEFIDSLELS